METLQVLLVHPPIFDFTAYDFWLRPYGMMRAASRLADSCRFTFFDYPVTPKKDSWGRGRIEGEIVAKPEAFRDIPRRFRRFGKPRAEFQELLRSHAFDAALIQTSMTYWYPGVREVIEDIRALQPAAKIVLGGVYATLRTTEPAGGNPRPFCPARAEQNLMFSSCRAGTWRYVLPPVTGKCRRRAEPKERKRYGQNCLL